MIGMAKITFDESSGQGGRLFADWSYMVIKSSGLTFGLVFIVFLIHAQIYMVLYAMQYVTVLVKNDMTKLEAMNLGA